MEIRSKRFIIYIIGVSKEKWWLKKLQKKKLLSWKKKASDLGIKLLASGKIIWKRKDHLIAKNFKSLNKEKYHPDFSVVNNNNQKSYLWRNESQINVTFFINSSECQKIVQTHRILREQDCDTRTICLGKESCWGG